MTTILLAFGLMLIVITIMAVGVILSNKPIKGSCGGLSALGMKESCMICGGDETQWRKEVEILGKADLAYDVMAEQPKSS
ncbi:(Na+)-NQR maturation NqrM [uncultured Oceanicoccus sp.]|uniref:(Na+)-NQR maturation NqrM n=1 Tax=uncultured Oceanicoccus sp. TaxID=1706381 RepID=UPI0030D89807